LEARLNRAQAENRKLEVRYERSELEADELKPVQKPEVGGQKSEVRNQKLEVGDREGDVVEEAGEEAELATKTDANLTPEATSTLPPPDDDGYVWPEGAEASVGAEGITPTATAAETPLPSLDELVKRIPADVRETLDDLFRVKYVSVKRVSPASLKS
jgi:hypothetical protein